MPEFLFMGIFLLAAIGFGNFIPGPARADVANHIVINEVSIDSVSGTGGTEDDWVELYNPTDEVVDVSGWSVQKTAGSGGSLVKVILSGAIQARGYLLIVRNGVATNQELISSADFLASNSFSLSSGNTVYLLNNNDDLDSLSDPNIVDMVGFGQTYFYEGSAFPSIPEGKSIARVPDGEDTNKNSIDFQVQNESTPTSAKDSAAGNNENGLGGTVLLTATLDAAPIRNIASNGAQVVFSINTVGNAQVKYGPTSSYGSATNLESVAANVSKTVSLSGLSCDTTYHYAVYAENSAGTENDQSVDGIFTTLPCGIRLDSLEMTRSSAKANDQYGNGWEWEFNITVWSMTEDSLKVKFDRWSGVNSLDAASNMQYSVDDGATWTSIDTNGSYPSTGVDISDVDESLEIGRQVRIIVRMKVPLGTFAGYYSSSYGILTE
jgi:hypothetical protein